MSNAHKNTSGNIGWSHCDECAHETKHTLEDVPSTNVVIDIVERMIQADTLTTKAAALSATNPPRMCAPAKTK
jgi:hypothetical protein